MFKNFIPTLQKLKSPIQIWKLALEPKNTMATWPISAVGGLIPKKNVKFLLLTKQNKSYTWVFLTIPISNVWLFYIQMTVFVAKTATCLAFYFL